MKGIRVVDMTQHLSGPYCTWLLGSLGADVIKIEAPIGDTSRDTPPYVDGISLYFASLNRNKRSVMLDLKGEAGREALHRLLATADVFIENLRPGVRDRLGCSDMDLERINPRLIKASISGFGQTGDLSGRPAYDIVVQAMSGMMSINGPLGGAPTRVGFSVGDVAASLFTAIGILERLYRRDAMGEMPQDTLDVSMLACQWACMENAFARYLNAGIVPGPIGSRHPSDVPFESFPSADRDFVVGVGTDHEWPRFCTAIGRPELAGDARYAGFENRLANRDDLWDLLAEQFRTQPAAHWLEQLVDHEIPCSAVETVETISAAPVCAERQAFSEVVAGGGQKMRFVRNPIADAAAPETAAPELGQHTAEVLEELGYDVDAIAALAPG